MTQTHTPKQKEGSTVIHLHNPPKGITQAHKKGEATSYNNLFCQPKKSDLQQLINKMEV